jgi:hypothetical protein
MTPHVLLWSASNVQVETIGDCYMVAAGLFTVNEQGERELGGEDTGHAHAVSACLHGQH